MKGLTICIICFGMQVMANEEVDPAVLIRLLRQEIADLREELR